MPIEDTAFLSRFWERVVRGAPTECWLWTGTKCAGWPELQVGEKKYKAHRVSYMIRFGPIPSRKYVRQTCANRLCVNPEHLSLASREDFLAMDPPGRFWAHVDTTSGCWLWRGTRKSNGYGLYWFGGRLRLAHRISWELSNGPIPEGLAICHNCPGGDNPSCVNPSHLFLGTVQENNADREAKGRTPRGSGIAHAKLTEAMVRETLRALHGNLASQADLARRFHVDACTIAGIAHGRSWRHVTENRP